MYETIYVALGPFTPEACICCVFAEVFEDFSKICFRPVRTPSRKRYEIIGKSLTGQMSWVSGSNAQGHLHCEKTWIKIKQTNS